MRDTNGYNNYSSTIPIASNLRLSKIDRGLNQIELDWTEHILVIFSGPPFSTFGIWSGPVLSYSNPVIMLCWIGSDRRTEPDRPEHEPEHFGLVLGPVFWTKAVFSPVRSGQRTVINPSEHYNQHQTIATKLIQMIRLNLFFTSTISRLGFYRHMC